MPRRRWRWNDPARRHFVLLTLLGAAAGVLVEAGAVDAAEAAAHPIIVGFERFFSEEHTDAAKGGRLLLGELGCVSCHRADDGLREKLLIRQAPVLDTVGGRVNVEWLRSFLADPQKAKPGATMPQMFHGLPPAERNSQVEALVHFLASTGTLRHTAPDVGAAERGRKLFGELGCFACHGSLDKGVTNPAWCVPLGDVAAKYTMSSLISFLREPHATRPSGRMPDLNLSPEEAADIASYFLRDIEVKPNIRYKYYEGSWEKLPDFTGLEPKITGGAAGFDLNRAPRKNNFGMRFEGWLHIEREGEYTFHAGSDDGSRITIDGRQIVLNDGHHPFNFQSAKVRLHAGAHPVSVDYMQGGGEWELRIEYEGPGVPRQRMDGAVTVGPERPPEPDGFRVDPDLAREGRRLFASVGCANCHQLRRDGRLIEPQPAGGDAPPLAELKPGCGCLSATPSPLVPYFRLSARQREALGRALRLDDPAEAEAEPDEAIDRTLATFNCYGCHSRDGVGGPPRELEGLFVAAIPEMGDEGRVPPPLDGVGDKLKAGWILHVLENGANDRPYMPARMPRFGAEAVGNLAGLFAKADAKSATKLPEIKTPPHRLKSAGRRLVGENAFSCIKCHTFAPHKATGIQALDLTQMTRRLREDWFHRYMLDPARYRPGTRMPTAFPGGVSTMPDVLDGDPARQLAAIWAYLSDGPDAPVPMGLVRNAIVLEPDKAPIIYRGFIEEVGPRGIAVGYPEKAHLCFDADEMCLALLWHNAFIDASMHWSGRGSGFQAPLGDHVVSLVRGAPFARLESGETVWPTRSAREQGYRFQGYTLDEKRRPVFRYAFDGLEIADAPHPVPARPDAGFRRTITLKSQCAGGPEDLWCRAAAGDKIEPLEDGWHLIDGILRTRISVPGGEQPLLRRSGRKQELLVPVRWNSSTARIVQEYVW